MFPINLPQMGVQAIVAGAQQYIRDAGKVQTATRGIGKAATEAGTTAEASGGRFANFGASVQRSVGNMVLALGTLSIVAGSIKLVFDKIIKSTIDYNKAMHDTASAVGVGVEEFSRITQVADDFGITQEKLATALEKATKSGYKITVESLAELADKTNAMADPTERAAYLAKLLGRSWSDLDPLLRVGGQRIRELARDIDDGLVVTEAEFEASEKLRLSIDQMNDSMAGLGTTLGNKLIPKFTAFLDLLQRPFTPDSAAEFLRDFFKGNAFIGRILQPSAEFAAQIRDQFDFHIPPDQLGEIQATTEEIEDQAGALDKLAAAAQKAREQNVEFYDTIRGRAESTFADLDTYARKYELGGVLLRVADEQVKRLLEGAILEPDEARQLADAFLPIEVVRKWAEENGYDLGESISEEMQKGLQESLVKAGKTEEEAGSIVKSFVDAPEEWVKQQEAVVLDMTKRLALEQAATSAGYINSIAEQAEATKPTLMEVYGVPANQLERALIQAELLNDVLGGIYVPPIRRPAREPEEGTGPMAASPADVEGRTLAGAMNNWNLTVNSAAPSENVISDFALMRALARVR